MQGTYIIKNGDCKKKWLHEPEQISRDMSYHVKITIKWGVVTP